MSEQTVSKPVSNNTPQPRTTKTSNDTPLFAKDFAREEGETEREVEETPDGMIDLDDLGKDVEEEKHVKKAIPTSTGKNTAIKEDPKEEEDTEETEVEDIEDKKEEDDETLTEEEFEKIRKRLKLPKDWKLVGNDKIQMKVNGKLRIVPVSDLSRYTSIGTGGYQAMQEKNAFEKRVNAEIEELKKDPKKLLMFGKKLGHSEQALAKAYQEILDEEIKESMMTEEEKRILAAERRAKELELKNQEYERQFQEQKEKEELDYHRKEFNTQVPKIIEKFGFKSPKLNAYMTKVTADILNHYIDQDIDLSFEQAADIALELDDERKQEYMDSLTELKGEHLLEVLPRSLVKNIQKALVERAERASGSTPYDTQRQENVRSIRDVASVKSKQQPQTDPYNFEDFFDLRKRKI